MQYRKKPEEEGGGYTCSWKDLCEQWDLIECDLLSEYGIDTWDAEFMTTTPWAMLKRKILGLLASQTRITHWARSQAQQAKK